MMMAIIEDMEKIADLFMYDFYRSTELDPCLTAQARYDIILNAIELLKRLPEWISVDDQLPEHNQIVVVSDGIHTWDVGQFHGLSPSQRRDLWKWKKNTIKKVKWWMPKKTALPCPPKEVKQDVDCQRNKVQH